MVFFGTPAWAVPSLEAVIAAGHDVSLVVTNPDRPAGRGLRLSAPPVKEAARAAGIEVVQPESARHPSVADQVAAQAPDAAVVVAYGKILPEALLAIPRLGFVNVHFSMLPRYRGAAPVQHALLDGDATTGVSIMVLTAGMDEGPVLATRLVRIEPDDNAASLGERLARTGADLLPAALAGYAAGELQPVEQDHARATYAPKLTSDDARIDWTRPAAEIRNLVRALDPEPGAWTLLEGARVRIFRVTPRAGATLAPGEIVAGDAFVVGTGDVAVEVRELQRAGGRRIAAADFVRGWRPVPGAQFQ